MKMKTNENEIKKKNKKKKKKQQKQFPQITRNQIYIKKDLTYFITNISIYFKHFNQVEKTKIV